MALMEQLRSGTDSTFMQVILALVAVSFIGWFAAPQGDMAQTVATVNGEMILDTEFFQRYRMAERQQGGNLDDTQREQLRAQVKQQLIQEAVVLQEAEKLGLVVSDREVARELLGISAFQKDGKFDEERYQASLRAQRLTRAAFEDTLRRDLLRRKLRVMVFQGASISEPVLRDAFVKEQTRIDLEYVRIRPAVLADQVPVTDEEVATFLVEDADRVTAAYKRDFKRLYDVPDKVGLLVVRLEKKDDGEDEAARLDSIRAELEAKPEGMGFSEHWAAVASRWSEDGSVVNGGDMGNLAVTQLSKDVQEALKDLELNTLSATVETAKDLRVFAVTSREAGREIPQEEVQNTIAKRLIGEERAPEFAKTFAQATVDAWASSGSLNLADLESKGLRPSSTGPVSLVPEPGTLNPPRAMLVAADAAKPGDVLPGVYPSEGVIWIGKLSDRQEADMSLYETEKSQVREMVLSQRRRAFYENWINDVVASADIK